MNHLKNGDKKTKDKGKAWKNVPCLFWKGEYHKNYGYKPLIVLLFWKILWPNYKNLKELWKLETMYHFAI